MVSGLEARSVAGGSRAAGWSREDTAGLQCPVLLGNTMFRNANRKLRRKHTSHSLGGSWPKLVPPERELNTGDVPHELTE